MWMSLGQALLATFSPTLSHNPLVTLFPGAWILSLGTRLLNELVGKVADREGLLLF